VAHAKDEDVYAFDKVLKEIRKDAAAFKRDPKGKVPELHPDAAKVFGEMGLTELTSLGEADDAMKKVGGFVVTVGEASAKSVSVKMV
jgi:pyruvate/2-oxoacid:ferredoxin oxidoreductase alpha subunit